MFLRSRNAVLFEIVSPRKKARTYVTRRLGDSFPSKSYVYSKNFRVTRCNLCHPDPHRPPPQTTRQPLELWKYPLHIDDLLQQDGNPYLASNSKSLRKILSKEPEP